MFLIILVSLQLGSILGQIIDPDISRTTCEIVVARGFPCERHNVTTPQGYIIELHRIPNASKKPVILQTGLIGTSADFIFASEHVSPDPTVIYQNMGIELAKQGYDVWMSNNRGSRYGMANTNLSPSSRAFWEFSFDEISQYDIPAIIDFVRDETGFDRVHYLGHSQGTAVMFALLTQNPAVNAKIESFIAVSPTPLIGLATTSFRPLIASLLPILLLGGPVFTENFVSSTLTPIACDVPIGNPICQVVWQSVVGFDPPQLNDSRVPVYVAHQPTSTSAQNLIHYNQMFNSDRFQKFDYGPLGNLARYGQLTAPIYPLESIAYPNIHVIYGDNDAFATLGDIAQLKTKLTTVKEWYEISNPMANHMDPLIGIDIAIEVNRKVIDILATYPLV